MWNVKFFFFFFSTLALQSFKNLPLIVQHQLAMVSTQTFRYSYNPKQIQCVVQVFSTHCGFDCRHQQSFKVQSVTVSYKMPLSWQMTWFVVRATHWEAKRTTAGFHWPLTHRQIQGAKWTRLSSQRTFYNQAQGMRGKSHLFTDQTNKSDSTKMSQYFRGTYREKDQKQQTIAWSWIKSSQTKHLQSYHTD